MSGSGSGNSTIGSTIRTSGNLPYIGRYFTKQTAKQDFYNFIKVNNPAGVQSKLLPVCNPNPEDPAIGASYIKDSFEMDDIPLIIVYTDNAETPDVKAFAFFKDNEDGTIELSLICSKVKGLGGHILSNAKSIAKNEGYKAITLTAINGGVASIYAAKGYKFIKLDDKNLAEMTLALERRETDPTGFDKLLRSGKKYGGKRSRKNGLRKRKTMRRRR